MGKVGSIALYLEVSNQDIWKEHETRASFVHNVFGNYEEGLRAGPRLAARRGYVGLLICAFTPEGYRKMLLNASDIYGKKIDGPWGRVQCVRIRADDSGHPWIRTLDIGKPKYFCMLDGPVRLKTYSPIRSPFSILKDLEASQRFLWEYSGAKDLEFSFDLPHWIFTKVRLKANIKQDVQDVTGSLCVFSSHKMAQLILDFAILRGFGSERERGFGSLDVIVDRGD
ncbi:hypothetical protein Tlie_0239 [Thermovirga lienii DSM 17291]|uniref:Uncharacterized protein n=1 Tax=Thermovirga lienii (strain ATCC BAA-1197 / DSM 17291 / Cas60314) TaxID=580340 RepID=G7V6F1_THELD|nr:hypothetical protein [Thermovirga lienii]AER65980.1 hypothetical protein Tlie_0239 [Thermovirga lienii DSM 17291]